MKTFKQYITESDDDELERLHLVDVLNMIQDDCQQFLHRIASNGKFNAVYSAMSTERWPIYEVQVRKDNAPIPTPKHIQDSFDRVMSEVYNTEFRSDSLYVSSDPGMTRKSSSKHLVFPIGRFDYLWSDTISDMIHGFGSEDDLSNKKGLYFDIQEAADEDAKDKLVKTFLKDNEFILNKDLKECINKGHDAMINCKYYYAIPTHIIHTHYETFQKMIGELNFKKSMKTDLL